jgi:hypothetical protein
MNTIIAASTHLIYDTTTGGFPKSGKLNLSGTVTTMNNLFSLKVTSVLSPDTSTYRGFNFNIGQKHHRVKYSFDYRFVPDVEGETAVMNQCGYEGATPRFTITMTPEWQTYSGLDNRSNYSSTYYTFAFYRNAKTFPLGTFYIRNFKLESFPWVYTIGGKPLKISV